jgi:hypothetical protein
MGGEEKGEFRLIFGRYLSKRTELMFFLGQRKSDVGNILIYIIIEVWPLRYKKFAASTGRTGVFSCEICNNFLGKGMLPKSQKRQTFQLWHTSGKSRLLVCSM